MDTASKARMQIRIVLAVWRLETERLKRLDLSPPDRLEWENALRDRSLSLLDVALATLDGTSAGHPEVRQQLVSARAEVNRQGA
jgi:hypothetical protein